VDPRIAECWGEIRTPGDGPLTLRASLVEGAVAVLLISGPVGDAGVARWRDRLAARYGSVPARREHGQESWQWVRRSRMIRLTTRREDGTRIASVSLVDGPLLDGLGPVPGRPAGGRP
jgi:hypothetical protein